MNIGNIDTSDMGSKNKTVGITGGMKGIGEALFTLLFYVVATFRIGRADFDLFRRFLFLWGKWLFSVFFTIYINFLIQLCLVASRFYTHDFLVEFLFILTRFYMRRINEGNRRIKKTLFHRFFQNPIENLFKQVDIFEMTDIVFTEGGEMRYFYRKPYPRNHR